MKKNFLFKGVSVLGAVLLLATSVMPGLQYAYAQEAPAQETVGLTWDYIYNEESWNESYANGALKEYYIWADSIGAYPYKEDLWNTVEERAANWNDIEKDEGGNPIEYEDGYHYINCERSWLGAINAPAAKYPWVAIALSAPFAGEVKLSYDDGDPIYPWGNGIKVSAGGFFGTASIPAEFENDDFKLDAEGKTTFDPTKLKITLTPAESLNWDYIHNETSWNASYTDGALKKYYAENPSEDLWNTSTNTAPGFNDKIYTVKMWTNADLEGDPVVKQFKAEWYSDNGVQRIYDVEEESNAEEDRTYYYLPTFFDTPSEVFELYAGAEGGWVATPDNLVYPCSRRIKVDSVSFGGPNVDHTWQGAISAPGAKYPRAGVVLPNSFDGTVVFEYGNQSEERNIDKGKGYTVISIPSVFGDEYILGGAGNFNNNDLKITLKDGIEDTTILDANYPEVQCGDGEHSILGGTACESDTKAVECENPAELDVNAESYTEKENITWDAETSAWPEGAPTCTIASCKESFHKNEAGTACVDNENLTITATKLPAASIPNDGNKEKSQENQNAVTVVQDDENNIVIYGVLNDLNTYPSTNEQQGEGKWVAIVLTTNLDTIAGAKWGNYTMTADDDVVESASVGLNPNQIIYWVKAEETLSTAKETTISADGYNPVTIKVKVEEKYTVTFVDEDGTTVLKEATAYDPQTAAADIVKPADPTKAADNTCNKYKFNGWIQELDDVTAHATYKATYTCTSKKTTSSGGGGGGSSSYSCKNLPDNATANNSTKPTKSTDYSYDTDITKVCTFQCDKGYSWNTKDAKCEKSDAQTNTGDTNTLDETNKDGITNGGNGGEGSSDGNKNPTEFSQEFIDAYNFAYKNGITTKESIEDADMYGPLTRIAMAKMLSQYAINVLGQKPDTDKVVPNFPDVDAQLDADYDNGVTLAYQLGIMGIGIQEFRPFAEVTRAEFGTALSRMLFGTADGEGNEWYKTHLDKLMLEKIITNDDPNLKELRGYVMIMLMRSASDK